jgi:hypothetical protein
MNIKEGGEGGFCSEEHRDKFLKAAKLISTKAGKIGSENKNWLLTNDDEWGENYRKKLSDSKIGNVSWSGLKHNEETKRKISETIKGFGVGSDNSQFGTRWITNGKENKKIHQYGVIPEGWKLGRILP